MKEEVCIVSSTVHILKVYYRGNTEHKRKDFVLLGCGTYFIIGDNTIQYRTIIL